MTAPTLTQDDVELFPTPPGELSHIIDQFKWSIADATVFGTEVEALCGYRFIPTRAPNPDRVCPECRRIVDNLGKGYVR